MKKTVRHASLALLVLSSSIFTACTPDKPATKPPEASQPDKGASQGPVDTKEVEAFADPIFAEKMKKYNVNGSSFVVVKDGKVVLNKGYGYADKEKNIPVDKDTVFQIASVTKTFTALAALQLVDEGKMELRGDIELYLGGLKVPNKTGTPLTLFDLLTYTSGVDYPDITTYVGPEFVDQDIPTKPFLAEHMPTVVRKPGEAYTYDNFAFLLAGHAVENVSGLRYDKYMQEKVFKPLGMNSTSARFTSELLARMAAHYDPSGKPVPTEGHAPTDGPQGSIISTAEDMSKYLIMQLQKGKYDGKQLVSPKSMDLMHNYQVFSEKSMPITTAGFEGYFPELKNGHHVVLKGGNMTGHQSLIVLLPDKNTGFFMSYNNDSMMSVEVYEAFMDHYFPTEKQPEKPTYIPLNEKEAQQYTGMYQNTRLLFLKTKFSYDNGNLIMETNSSGKHTLKMIHPLLFEDESGNKLAFKKDSHGQIEYFYYSNRNSMDFASDAQKVHEKTPFDDVAKDSPYKTHIDNLNTWGIMGACTGNSFQPQSTMTQGEFADVLLKAHGWYGIVFSVEGNKKMMVAGIPGFDRNAPVTRQIAAAMVQNMKQLEPASEVKLAGTTDEWAVKAVTALVSQGIVDPGASVKPDGSVDFRSKQPLLRQEAAVLLDKAFGSYTLPLKVQ
ncbi:serine hydrolase [Paenibacillus sp. GbtcB18]|uniref:serine hydrolase n=1 Tax=Paenibacillus sp. GbtcB18 TaxID=2824763 RepID=UPI001C2F5A48|nr:serine hydrolase [Paenibacillus sp. GbtcB18]